MLRGGGGAAPGTNEGRAEYDRWRHAAKKRDRPAGVPVAPCASSEKPPGRVERFMSRRKSDTSDKLFVQRFLADVCGLSAHLIPSNSDSQSADFDIEVASQRVFTAELKSFPDCPPSPERGWRIERDEDGIEFASRRVGAFARIARGIKKAYAQLQTHPRPWGVVFLNHDFRMTPHDFWVVFSGGNIYKGPADGLVVDSGEMRVALGDTRTLRYQIDLYLWIDAVLGNSLSAWWATPAGEAIVREYFGMASERQPTEGDHPSHR